MGAGPYTRHRLYRTKQAEDEIFRKQGGHESLANVVPISPENPGAGRLAQLRVTIDPTSHSKISRRWPPQARMMDAQRLGPLR